MSQITRSKKYDLEERTAKFAKDVIEYIRLLPKTVSTLELSKQLIRSAGSVGANYIEANESLSKKDFLYRVKICKKETKETRYWLDLLSTSHQSSDRQRNTLFQEATELMKIFSAIIEKSK